MIEKKTNSTISEIFKSDSNIDNFFIESPLESSELSPIVIQNQVIELLNYNLVLHYVMLYLIIMCIFIFTRSPPGLKCGCLLVRTCAEPVEVVIKGCD